MAVMSAEVVPTPGAKEPFKVVVTHGGSLLAEYPFPSNEEAEEFILESAKALQSEARKGGYLK